MGQDILREQCCLKLILHWITCQWAAGHHQWPFNHRAKQNIGNLIIIISIHPFFCLHFHYSKAQSFVSHVAGMHFDIGRKIMMISNKICEHQRWMKPYGTFVEMKWKSILHRFQFMKHIFKRRVTTSCLFPYLFQINWSYPFFLQIYFLFSKFAIWK